jgi:hypothetical protein
MPLSALAPGLTSSLFKKNVQISCSTKLSRLLSVKKKIHLIFPVKIPLIWALFAAIVSKI